MIRRPPRSPLFPSPPLSRSAENHPAHKKPLSVARAVGCAKRCPATERLHHAGGSISGGERRRVTYRRSGSSFFEAEIGPLEKDHTGDHTRGRASQRRGIFKYLMSSCGGRYDV